MWIFTLSQDMFFLYQDINCNDSFSDSAAVSVIATHFIITRELWILITLQLKLYVSNRHIYYIYILKVKGCNIFSGSMAIITAQKLSPPAFFSLNSVYLAVI